MQIKTMKIYKVFSNIFHIRYSINFAGVIMSDKHLAAGSVEPPRNKDLLRIYSMKSCPFAQRTRLVLRAKSLPHDIVNIDLQAKPDWYFKIHPKGQVPALVDGDQIVIESLDIADYLDEKYPEQTPLYPSDPAAKEKDQKVIRDLIGPAVKGFGQFSHANKEFSVEEALEILLPPVQPLEDELARRGTKYFGGDKPGMIDYMLWPWGERSAVIPLTLGLKKIPLKDDQIPNLRKWNKAMLEDPSVQALRNLPEKYKAVADARKNNTLVYDEF